MALYKNVDSQKLAVYAYDTSADAPKTGDAAQITARISKDGAAVAQSNDAAPTELDATYAEGVYLFDLTQAETNCDLFILSAESSTGNILIEPVIVYTLPGTNAGVDVESDALFGTQLADSIPADGTIPTAAQALYMIFLRLYEAVVTGTTVSLKKVDGTTELLTLTLDDATDPTSITRAT